jgi:molybdenum cofactor biosynthesis protein B
MGGFAGIEGPYETMNEREFLPIRIAVLTVSDTRQLADDRSGDVLVNRIADAGHVLVDRKIIADERMLISSQLLEWCGRDDVDAIISTGGTGLTGRDVTVEAHRDVYEKEIDAFGTVFTIVSMKKIGTSAIQSRATAGVAQGTYMFALPGSPGACKDGWDEILSHQLDYRHKPCNFVEIMPRLDEHQRRK